MTLSVVLVLVLALVVIGLGGCTAGSSEQVAPLSSGASGTAGSATGPGGNTAALTASASASASASADDLDRIRSAMTAFNAAAGGPVATQQGVLAGLVSPGQQQTQRSCPKATTTLAFEPVYADLALAPNWRPAHGSLNGTVYSLPSLIRIFTGDRVTGTDLADLHIAVSGGKALFAALCVG